MIGKRLHVITTETSQNESGCEIHVITRDRHVTEEKEMAPFGRVVTELAGGAEEE